MNARTAPMPDAVVDTAADTRGQALPLAHGRQLVRVPSGGDDLIEIRGSQGVELRIRMTADGPMLQMESLRLSLKAAQDVSVECANFSVHARQAMELNAAGALRIQGEADMHVDAQGEVHVKGSVIHLN